MCISPTIHPLHGPVACRLCWQCRQSRVDDLCGRSIAEARFSDHVMSVTLTYGEDTPHAAVLVYKDVQDFLKRLRYHRYSVRYLVAGEYGSKGARAHWHAILFFRGKKPDIPENETTGWEHWPHGHVFARSAGYKGFRYVLKYVLKDLDSVVSQSHISMSKKPILGFDFVNSLADEYVMRGLPLQDPAYSFRDVLDVKGKPRQFWLRGKAQEILVDRYLEHWSAVHETPHPESEWLADFLATREARRHVPTDDEILESLRTKPYVPRIHETGPGSVSDDVYLLQPGLNFSVVLRSDGSVSVTKQENSWLAKDADHLRRLLQSLKLDARVVSPLVRRAFPRASLDAEMEAPFASELMPSSAKTPSSERLDRQRRMTGTRLGATLPPSSQLKRF